MVWPPLLCPGRGNEMSETELLKEVRLVVSDWQLGAFSARHFGSHLAMSKLVALLAERENE